MVLSQPTNSIAIDLKIKSNISYKLNYAYNQTKRAVFRSLYPKRPAPPAINPFQMGSN